MKKNYILTTLVGLLFVLSAAAETFTINGSSYDVTRTTTQLASGVTYTKLKFNTIRNSSYELGSMIHIVEADLTDPTVSVKHGDSSRDSRKKLATHAANLSVNGATVVAGANANFWVTTEQPWATKVKYEPHGVSIKDGHMYTDPNCGTTAHVGGPTVTGMLAIDENGKCYIDYLKPQVNGMTNSTGSGWNFTITNHTHPHTFGIDQVNRVSCPGTASMYTSIYGSSKTFRSVVSSTDYSTYSTANHTEVILDFASGVTEWNIGGTTRMKIAAIRTNTAGNGTLGDHDAAIVCRDSYATVANGWAVGDEITITAIVNFQSQGTPNRIMQATSGNCICMANGVVGYNSTQESYNKNSNERTLYGTNDAGTKLWIAVCEHKPAQETTYLGFSTTQMAYVLKNFGATWAMQVDCGGSAQMYAGGKQVSQSYDSGGIRNVQSGVFILSTPSAGSGGGTTEPETPTDPTPDPTGSISLNLNYQDVAITQLSGKTVKRVVPSNDGSHLYILAHDASNNPTVLVYNHTTKTVKEQLGLSGIIGTSNSASYKSLSDIDVTDDNYLVGIGEDYATTSNGGRIFNYKWKPGSDGIATGNPLNTDETGAGQWNVFDNKAGYSEAIIGEAMAYYGTVSNGYMFYTVQKKPTSGTEYLRWVRLTLTPNISVNDWSKTNGSTARNNGLFLDASSHLGASAFMMNEASDQMYAYTGWNSGDNMTESPVNLMPTAARHTPIFKHGDHYYMVGATATGVQLADVTSGVASGSAVTVNATALTSNSTTNVAAAGTSFNSGNDIALFVVREGKISRYSSSVNAPVAPVLSGDGGAYLASDGTVHAVFSWNKVAGATNYDVDQYVNGAWTTFQHDFGENFTTLDWQMPDQTSKSWTIRVRAKNSAGTSPWSNEVTISYTPPADISVSAANIELEAERGATAPYKDITVTAENLTSDITYTVDNEAVTLSTVNWNARTGGTLRVTLNMNEVVGTQTGVIDIVSGDARAEVNYTATITEPDIDVTESLQMYLNYQDVAIAELQGKTIKRIVPSTDGEYLYILAHEGTTPTLLVYNHKNKTVKEILKTANCVSGRVYATSSTTGDVVSLSDIDVADDGVLVGIGESVVPYIWHSGLGNNLADGGVYVYKWAKGSDGIATGDAIRWFDSEENGGFNNATCGEVFAYRGTTTTGYAYYSARTYGGANVRWERLTIASGAPSAHLRVNQHASYSHTDLFIDASPISEAQFLYNSASVDFAEMTMGASAEAIAASPDAPTTTGKAGVPTSARHTPIFTYNGHYYVVGAKATGVALADVTKSIPSASAVNINVPALSSNTTTNVAAAGTTFHSTHLGLFAVRDGKISKYSTIDNPVAPTLSSTGGYMSGSTAKAKFSWTAPANTEYYDTEYYEDGAWKAFRYGVTSATLDVDMPDQTTQSLTLRVRAGNGGGTSAWSEAVTATVAGLHASETSISLSGTPGGSAPYQDITIAGQGLAADITYSASNSAVSIAPQSGWNARTGGTLRVTLNMSIEGTQTGTITVTSGSSSATINYTASVSAAWATPVLTAGSAYMSGSTLKANFTCGNIDARATHIDYEQFVNGAWTKWEYGFDVNAWKNLDYAIPDGAKTWTLRARVHDGNGNYSAWSNSATVTYSDANQFNVFLNYEDVEIPQLAGKTIKKVVPSKNGKYLYILAHSGNDATLISYNHTTRESSLLGLSTIVGTNYKSLSDIDVTDDGWLVGIGEDLTTIGSGSTYAEIASSGTGTLYMYKWAPNSDGLAVGHPRNYNNTANGQWNVWHHNAQYSTQLCGRAMAYYGNINGGYMFYTATNGESGAGSVRWIRVTINSNSQIGPKAYQRVTGTSKEYAGVGLFIDAIDATSIIQNEQVQFASYSGFNDTDRNTLTQTPTSVLTGGTVHTPLFTYNGVRYVIGATATGVQVYNVTNWASPTAVTLSGVTDLSSNSTTNVAATAAAYGSKGDVALFVVRDGKISKYSTEMISPTAAPVLTADRAYFDGTTARADFHWTAPDGATGYEFEYTNKDGGTSVQGGLATTTISGMEIPNQTTKSVTIRVRAKNISGIWSDWSNEVTLSCVTAPTLSGAATMEADGQAYGRFSWNVPANAAYFDIQHQVNGTWTDYKTGLGTAVTSLIEAMPDQTAQTWTIRVRARNNTCTSDWSSEATATFSGYDRVFVGTDLQDPYSWNNAANWSPAHVPTLEHDVLLKAPCEVNGVAAAKSINLRKGTGYESVRLTVLSTGALTVQGTIRQVTDDAWGATRTVHTASDLVVKADANGQGVLAQFDTEGKTPATVEVYGMHANGDGRWTFVSVPFAVTNVQNTFNGSWMMEWIEAENDWRYLDPYDDIPTFKGYLLTQETPKSYTLRGTLHAAAVKTIDGLTSAGSGDEKGSNMVGNSWTAPLQISKFNASDFSNVEPTVYVYDYQKPVGEAPVGYYRTASIGTTNGTLDVINPLQAFFVVATANGASVRLDYDALVNHTEQPSLNPYRAPEASVEREEIAIRITGNDDLYCDLRLLQQADFTHDFDAGFDGRKLVDEAAIPYLAAASTAGDMAILATPDYDGTFLNFRKGSGTSYTITFTYNGEEEYRLEDAIAGEAADIFTGNTYTFEPSDDDSYRFRIVRVQRAPDIATDAPNIWANDGSLYLTNPANVRTEVSVYSADGKLVERIVTSESLLQLQAPSTGVYMIQLRSEMGVQMIKHVM